jgi:hypothetical protein
MKFNPSDKAVSIVADIDFLLFGNSSTLNTEYSLTDRTRNVNNAWDEAVAELYKADPNHKWDDTTNSDLPFATLDLTEDQDHYSLLDSALVIHRVRVKDRNGAYKTLTPAVRSELPDDILNATGDPTHYYKIGGVVFPVPVPNYGYDDGVELEFQRGANHFTITSVNDAPGFNSQFHRFLSVSAALDYAIAQGMAKKEKSLSELKEQIRMKMVEHYQLRSPDERPRVRLRQRSLKHTGL